MAWHQGVTILLIPLHPPPHPIFWLLEPSDADDQTGAVQRPRAADAELGTLPAQVPPQEPGQAPRAEEEDREEGVHTVPSSTAGEPGQFDGKHRVK